MRVIEAELRHFELSRQPPGSLVMRTEKLVSLDALCGFDVFWIIGGTAILMGVGKVIRCPFFDKFLEHFDHVP